MPVSKAYWMAQIKVAAVILRFSSVGSLFLSFRFILVWLELIFAVLGPFPAFTFLFCILGNSFPDNVFVHVFCLDIFADFNMSIFLLRKVFVSAVVVFLFCLVLFCCGLEKFSP